MLNAANVQQATIYINMMLPVSLLSLFELSDMFTDKKQCIIAQLLLWRIFIFLYYYQRIMSMYM